MSNEYRTNDNRYEIISNKTLFKCSTSLLAISLIWFSAHDHLAPDHSNAHELNKQHTILDAFYRAGVPYEQKGTIYRALFKLNGDCKAVQADLQNVCEQAKTNLGLVYKAPPPPKMTAEVLDQAF